MVCGACSPPNVQPRCLVHTRPGGREHFTVLDVAAFVIKYRRGDLFDTSRFGDGIDLDDLALRDSEPHDSDGTATDGDHDSSGSVDQRRVQLGAWHCAYQCLIGDGRCTVEHLRSTGSSGAKVGSKYDLRIEHCDQRIEITTSCCLEEGVDNFTLPSKIRIGSRYLGTFHAAPRSAG